MQLPETLDAVLLDRPLSFLVLALELHAFQEYCQARRRTDGQASPLARLAALQADSAELELVLRGTEELKWWSKARIQEIEPGQSARFAVRLANTGSLDLEGVALSTSVPAGWSAALNPDTLALLPADEHLRTPSRLGRLPRCKASTNSVSMLPATQASAASKPQKSPWDCVSKPLWAGAGAWRWRPRCCCCWAGRSPSASAGIACSATPISILYSRWISRESPFHGKRHRRPAYRVALQP
ncbi:MAG: hypothetical protein FJY95_18610 [Candidatus Handelsmanbacteria bacterium]|nr:hypothetical protein [Candidatus Handelsmanbacteria bacterium]